MGTNTTPHHIMHSNTHILQKRNNEIQKPINSTQGIQEATRK